MNGGTIRKDGAQKDGAWPVGFSINRRETRPAEEWLEKYSSVPTSWVSDCLGRTIGTYGLKTYHDDVGITTCGTALTVRVRPGDNLMIHKALEIAEEGDVLVVDGGADVSQALMGGNMRLTCMFRGVRGVVVDGAIRDLTDWADGEMPIWARGHTHRGPSKDGPGEINVPIVCAGLVVNPGDLVLGDADGIVAVNPGRLEELWPLVQKHEEKEHHQQSNNRHRAGDPERFNTILRAKGCPV